ncbi:MAG: hypothetical protein RIR00_2273 [Pseudomonadota bacterium]|jgi:predicted Fe-S protein YdhL (DUF1289 family)
MSGPAAGPDSPPRSPCIGLCLLEPDGLCRGCLRSIEEISYWSRADDAQKRQILAAVATRRADRTGEA